MVTLKKFLAFFRKFLRGGEERPWGRFDEIDIANAKILQVKQGEELSYQFDRQRREMWVVISGKPLIKLNDRTLVYDPGEVILINEEDRHQVLAYHDDVVILELSLGDFSEGDIVRLEDKYNRRPTIETE